MCAVIHCVHGDCIVKDDVLDLWVVDQLQLGQDDATGVVGGADHQVAYVGVQWVVVKSEKKKWLNTLHILYLQNSWQMESGKLNQQ